MTNNKPKPEKLNDKEQPVRRHDPVEVIRRGAIAASIWRRQTPTGFEYLDFSLSRSWKMKTGEKEGYSQNFFAGNEEALHEVIAEACEFIRHNQPAGIPRESAGNGDSEKRAA
jgi:hypothetical protein